MILTTLAIVFGILGTYYGCRHGFKAWQWEHRHGEVSKQLAEVLKNNGDWAVWYEALNNNYRDALRELSLLKAERFADQVQQDSAKWVLLLDAGDTEGGSHD